MPVVHQVIHNLIFVAVGEHNNVEKAATSTSLRSLLESYQATVRFLLNENDYPGITAEELELFKSQFRHSAFTCRLGSCPRATMGFESHKRRLEHELTHIRRFQCTIPGCKYPFPFGSKQALLSHITKHHESGPPRKSIRGVRTGKISTYGYQTSSGRDSQDHADVKSLLNPFIGGIGPIIPGPTTVHMSGGSSTDDPVSVRGTSHF